MMRNLKNILRQQVKSLGMGGLLAKFGRCHGAEELYLGIILPTLWKYVRLLLGMQRCWPQLERQK